MIDTAKALISKITGKPPLMVASMKALEIIKHYEGLARIGGDGLVHAYICPAGKPTIGYGATRNVHLGDVMTIESAVARLIEDVKIVERELQKIITVPIKQCQFDAITAWAYNIGTAKASTSSLVRYMNTKKPELAASEFERWNKAMTTVGGIKAMRPLEGLAKRRKTEALCFLGLPYILG